VDFFSAEEPLLELELESAPESLVLDSLALAGVVEELPFRLSVR
jgi:hypothetical protein